MYDAKWKKPGWKYVKNSNYIVFYKRQSDSSKKWVLVSVGMGEATDHKGSERASAVPRLSCLLIMIQLHFVCVRQNKRNYVRKHNEF